jgi:23S rRNA (uracil1939-C5)-methyltransferase
MIELTISALTHAGEGLARHRGRAVFVPFALPGETVRVELIEEKKNYARARLVEVVTAASERVVPRCPHHFNLVPEAPAGPGPALPGPFCGGCQLQHLAHAGQLAFKQQIVREQLQRIGGLDVAVRPTLPSPNPYYYRNHAQFSLAPTGKLGLRAAQSHTVIPIRECHQIEPVLGALYPHIALDAEALPAFERLALRAGAEDEAMLVLEGAPEAPELELDLPISVAALRPDGTALAMAGRDYVLVEVRGRAFQVSAGSFFQVNTAVAEALVGLVLDGLALSGGEAVLDLYCGVGLFTAFLAPVAARVVGVEAYGPAVDDAAANLDEFDNVEIYEAPVEDVLPQLAGRSRMQAAVLDPPRAGCAPLVLAALSEARIPRLVYVSCDAATLARDLRRLVAGGYVVDWVHPLDMFPQTHHVECVVQLTLT